MHSLEERVIQMIALQRQKIPDDKIASYLHLSPNEFASFVICLKKNITHAAKNNTERVSRYLNLPRPLVIALAEHYDCALPASSPEILSQEVQTTLKKSERTLRKIKAGIVEGKTILQIAQEIRVRPSSIRMILEREQGGSIKDVQFPPTSQHSEILERILPTEYSSLLKSLQKSHSLGEMENKESVGRERVSQMIEEIGAYFLWRIKREELKYRRYTEEKEKVLIRQQLFSQLIGHIQHQCTSLPDEKWPEKVTAKYILRTKKTKRAIPGKNLLSLFRHYQTAKIRGETPSLESFAKRNHIPSAGQVLKIFKRMNLSVFNAQRKACPVSVSERDAFNSSKKVGMSAKDIAYFSNFSRETVLRCRSGGHAAFIIGYAGRECGATCRLASQVYELKDKKKNNEEIRTSTGIQQEALDYILMHRSEIEKEIIDVLRLFNPDKEITTPYIR